MTSFPIFCHSEFVQRFRLCYRKPASVAEQIQDSPAVRIILILPLTRCAPLMIIFVL